jgi:hypothetical protein
LLHHRLSASDASAGRKYNQGKQKKTPMRQTLHD